MTAVTDQSDSAPGRHSSNGEPDANAPTDPRDGDAETWDAAWDFAATQLRNLVTNHPGQTPTYTERGRWFIAADQWAPTWTGGFLAGQLWLLSRHTPHGDWFSEQARTYTLALENRKGDRSTHDIGFLLEPSFGRWFDATGDEHAADVLVAGGRTMAQRFQRHGRYLSTWVDPGSTFIDVMMNVGIIFRAARLADDPALFDVAVQHSRTSRKYLVRGDGSTLHEGWFDTDSGEFLRAATHQGYRSDSCWARGQAWAIYGFADAYRHSGDDDLLATARTVADYYLRQLSERALPPNDFDDPEPALPVEASAGSIAAAGLLTLANVLESAGGDGAEVRRYREAARRTLRALCAPDFLASGTPGWEGLIRHSTYHQRNGLGVNESVMWGDYYFLTALDLLTQP